MFRLTDGAARVFLSKKFSHHFLPPKGTLIQDALTTQLTQPLLAISYIVDALVVRELFDLPQEAADI